MIELGGLPGISGMARGTIGSEFALMRFDLLVTGITILWQRLQVNNVARGIGVAIGADHRGVLAR